MCLITAGNTRDCSFTFGGVARLWIANKEEIDTVTADATGITAVTMTATNTFYELEIEDNSGLFNQELVVNGSNKYYKQTVGFRIKDMNETNNANIENMSNAKAAFVVLTKAGKYFGLNMQNPDEVNGMTAMEGSASAGQSKDDEYGYQLTFEGNEVAGGLAPELPDGGTVIAGLV